MNKDSVERLLRDEGVTFQELDHLYRQCKQSLNEFFQVFHNKTDALNSKDLQLFLNLAQMQGISKDIQALSGRVIDLEGKIESVSKTLTDCEKNQSGHCVACDRKTLPISSSSNRPKDMPNMRMASTPSDTPFIIPETIQPEKRGALRGGRNTTKLKTTTPGKKRKEVTWSKDSVDSSEDFKSLTPPSSAAASCNIPAKAPTTNVVAVADQNHSRERIIPVTRDSSTMTTQNPHHHHHHPHQHHKCGGGGRPVSSSSEASSAVADRPSLASDSYVKVYKLIPELLSKFEEFHQSFSRACDADKHIEPSTAADVLKVMDGHLKLLESLEARLHEQCSKGTKNK